MTRTPPTERQVIDWLRDLARLLPRQNISPEEAAGRIRELLPLLVERYESEDFDLRSREYVARHCPVYFPSYGQICQLLDERPRPPERKLQAPPDWPQDSEPPRQGPPSEEEKAAVHELVQQAVAAIKAAGLAKSRPFPGLPPKPLSDVTLKGEALRQSRLARGCNVPVQEEADGAD